MGAEVGSINVLKSISITAGIPMTQELTHRSYVKLSKFMAYLLRHDRNQYQLSMDRNGFVRIEDLLAILRTRWPWADELHVREVVERSEKRRYLIVGDRIRANYGHSILVDVELPAVRPPEFLYHGTTSTAVEKILREGLRPMDRNYVHLSGTREEAVDVGKRRQKRPVVLNICARKAWEDGVEFRRSHTVYLVKRLEPEYLVG